VNGIIPEQVGYVNKEISKKSLRDIIADVINHVGFAEACEFLDGIKNLGYRMAYEAGLSFNLDDIIIPKEKAELIEKGNQEVQQITDNYNMGFITDNERYNQVIDTWTHVNNDIGNILLKQMTEAEAAADENWSVFNANRYAPADGSSDATLNTAMTLQKGVDGSIVLKPVKEGTSYKISVAKDFSAVTISGEAAPEPSEDTYIIAGSSAALLGTEWDGTNEANKLTLNETTGLYEKTYEGVTLAKGTIEFKIVKNGTTWIPEGMGNNHTCEIPADGVYTVKVTFNAANPEKVDDYEMVATPATGINGVKADALKDAQIYNLQGVRVDKAQKGLYIVNGRKVVIK
jgi:hypothetical protein